MLKKLRHILCFGLSLIVSLSLLLSFGGGADMAGLELGPGSLPEEADAIVTGTVVSTVSRWNHAATGIYSEVVVSVEQSLKGPSSGSTLVERLREYLESLED